MPWVPKDKNMKAGMLSGKNETSKGSQYGSLLHNQVVEVAQNSSAARKRSQKPAKDAQSSKSGKSQGNNRSKKISEGVDHVKTAKITQSFNLNQSLPNMSSGQHANGHTVEGFPCFCLYLRPEMYFANLRTSSTVSYTESAVYDNTSSTKCRLNQPNILGDNHVDGFSRRALETIEDQDYEDPVEKAARFRDAWYVLKSRTTLGDY